MIGRSQRMCPGISDGFLRSFGMGENVDEKHGFQINQFPSDEQ